MTSRDTSPTCFRCASLEREIHRLRVQARQDLDELEECRSDIRALRRAVYRLSRQLDAAEDRLAEYETEPEETP